MGSTSRVRAFQYIPYLESKGISVSQAPLFKDDYIKELYDCIKIQIRTICSAYLRRVFTLLKIYSYDLLWIEKELLPWLPEWAEMLLFSMGIPYVVDYDDAIFHRYDMHANKLVRKLFGRKIDRVMSHAALVTVGNDYLAMRALRAGAKRVEKLPSVVDLEKYEPLSNLGCGIESFNIGWIGSPVTVHYLETIREALYNLCVDGVARLIIVGARQANLEGLPIEFREWSEETEVSDINTFDVGIMPLMDGLWERGKCGYKIVQYMACAKPTVASPVGINQQIIDDGQNGFLASSTAEWIKTLKILHDDKLLRADMGKRARSKVEKEYSLQVTAPRFVSLLRDVSATYS